MTATQNASKCQDSGQMVLAPVTSQCGHLTAWCGCCGRTVFVVIRPGDGNEIPHYADHAGRQDMDAITVTANTVTGTIEVQTQGWADDDPRWTILDRGTYLAVATEVEPWGEDELSMDKATEAVRDNLGLTVDGWAERPEITGEVRFATVTGRSA